MADSRWEGGKAETGSFSHRGTETQSGDLILTTKDTNHTKKSKSMVSAGIGCIGFGYFVCFVVNPAPRSKGKAESGNEGF